ncbi:hypothetical protein BDR26DRAFT_923478 [Obelidium mucronatum]|nr:hypothetical protein BDR26DRAFT_923478 [Obelidium mucronatum]
MPAAVVVNTESANANATRASSTKALLGVGFSAAKDVAMILDPYLPQSAKSAALYVETQAVTATEFATRQAEEIRVLAYERGHQILEKSGALVVAEQIEQTRVKTQSTAINVVEGVKARAWQRYADTWSLAHRVAFGAADVVLAYTPKAAVDLVKSAISSVDAVRVEGLQGLKGRVPDFVITTATQSYEIFDHTIHTIQEKKQATYDSVNQTYSQATGFIVSKVNGTVHYIVAVPAVHTLLARLRGVVGEDTFVGRVLSVGGLVSSDKPTLETTAVVEGEEEEDEEEERQKLLTTLKKRAMAVTKALKCGRQQITWSSFR